MRAITEIGEYLREGGGKRLRPALLLLAAKLLDYQRQRRRRLGAVVEIIHTATLVHDDIIDEAQTRRGRPAANTQWGNSKCVLAGDWLYMQAFKIAVQERNFRILDLLIELTQQMVEGELLQMEKLGKLITLRRAPRSHLSQDRLPVLRLHASSAAVLGGATEQQKQRLGAVRPRPRHGFPDRRRRARPHRLRRGPGQARGQRPARRQSHHGRHPCPGALHPRRARKIETVLRDRAFNGVTHADILAILQPLRFSGVRLAEAAKYAASARNRICTFPDSEIKRALLWAPEFVVAREK